MKKNIIIRLFFTLNISVLLSFIIFPISTFAWSDNSGLENGRPEYTLDQINNGELGDTITFNSIKDSVIGHEFNFVGALEEDKVNSGEKKIWQDDVTVEDGKTYVVRMYVHNNNPNGRKAVAKNTHVAFSIPGASNENNQLKVIGFVDSPDATPTEVYDHVNFNSDQPFHLEYVSNSAFLENNGIGSKGNNGNTAGGVRLSDDIVNAAAGGILIGYDKLDGNIPGCYQYACYIGITLKAVYDYEYTIKTSVRPAGTKGNNWTDNLEVKIGDEVEYQILYENVSNFDQYNVSLRDRLPEGVEYIPGSTRIWNEHFTGDKINEDTLVTDEGINIGAYGPGANGYVRFNAKIVDQGLECGSNTLVNWGQGSVNNELVQDYASVILYKDTKFATISTILLLLIMTCLVISAMLVRKIYEDKY